MQSAATTNFDDEPYSVVQVGEDKEEMLRLQKMKYERKQQAKQRDAAAKEAKNNKTDAFANAASQKKGGKEQQQQPKNNKEEPASKAVPRGKKAKLQKMKDKYADQDEDERAMRLQLLGAKKTKNFEGTMQHAQKKAFVPAQKQQESEEEEEVQEEVEVVPVEEEEKKAEEEEVTPADEEVVGEDGKSEDDEDEGNEDEEKKEIEQLMKEEDINVLPEDVDLAEIDKLTGIPKSNDLILALVPMCAPYSAIQTYKYKVKLQAGTLKRGKAQKLIKNLFVQQAQKTATPHETQLVRNVPDPDMTNMLINSVRVLAPGLTKVQNQTKQVKRSGPKKE